MKLKVWSEEEAKNADDKQLFVKLKTVGGDIGLLVCDKNGEKIDAGSILIIDNDLHGIILCAALNKEIPLKTDFVGHALVTTEMEYKNIKMELAKETFMSSMVEMIKEKIDKHEKECSSTH